ncbi:MAG: PQQ-binding-like beta-propeller repeat protein [Pirellulales bacterium]
MPRRGIPRAAAFLFCAASLVGESPAADWTQFRGPGGLGRANEAQAPATWNAFRNLVWSTPLPGSGCSSPVVIGDRIWLTTAETTALTTEQLRQRAQDAEFPLDDFQVHQSVALFALELDGKSGRVLRRIRLFAHDSPPAIHVWNHYASPTPAADDRQLYCHFGALGTAAIRWQTGEIAWQQRLAVDDATGPGSSPIVWRERLFLACDGRDKQFVVALDVHTGKELWKTARPPIEASDEMHRRAFSTPIVVPDGDGESLVSVGAQWLVAYDPLTGREKWKVNFGTGYSIVPMPGYRDGLLFACTGYPKPQLWAVRTGGTGDVTDSHVAWIYDRQVPELSSPLAVDEQIYLASLSGVLACLDAKTGAKLWQQRVGGSFHASPIAVGNHVYFVDRDGTTTVVKAGREYQVMGTGQAAGIHQATPAVYNHGLLLRSSEGLYFVRTNNSP